MSKHLTLPTFVGIGAIKAGTSSLHYYLRQHPEIGMSWPKEVEYFAESKNWSKGVEWYSSHFDRSKAVRGEVSPIYSSYPQVPAVPSRMADLIPDAKLIYLVRHPIQRTISQYLQRYANLQRDGTFEEEILPIDVSNPLISRSLYYLQVEQYLSYFDREQILVVKSEDLDHNRLPTLHRIFSFLGVDPTYQTMWFSRRKHPSHRKRRLMFFDESSFARMTDLLSRLPDELHWFVKSVLLRLVSRPIKRPVPDPDLASRLWSIFGPDVEKLAAFTGDDYSDWYV